MNARSIIRRAGPAVLVVAVCALAAAEFVDLYHYKCVYWESCGSVSRACWAIGHPWGSSACTYCDGDADQDLCERSYNVYCPYIGLNQSCGQRHPGICYSIGPANIGYCMGDEPSQVGDCTVPRC